MPQATERAIPGQEETDEQVWENVTSELKLKHYLGQKPDATRAVLNRMLSDTMLISDHGLIYGAVYSLDDRPGLFRLSGRGDRKPIKVANVTYRSIDTMVELTDSEVERFMLALADSK